MFTLGVKILEENSKKMSSKAVCYGIGAEGEGPPPPPYAQGGEGGENRASVGRRRRNSGHGEEGRK